MTAAAATANAAGSGALPVTILTGFLGAGKTTLVNRLLSAPHGRRLAVLVNEFGAVGIDAELIVGAAGPVVELANGCICCATQGDLYRALAGICARGDLDGVLVETSGLADPAPIEEGIVARRFPRELRVDAIVTVIDAANFDDNLERAEAAYHQIARGDLLLVNKVDLVDPTAPRQIARGIRTLNHGGRIIDCVSCAVPADVVMGTRRLDAGFHLHRHDHGHDDFQSAVLCAAAPLDAERFDAWLDTLPTSIYRAKGFVRLAGVERPLLVHVVGTRRSVELAPGQVDTAGARLVVIGHDLQAAPLQAGLRACTAMAGEGVR
jgi:G3E family GTPase